MEIYVTRMIFLLNMLINKHIHSTYSRKTEIKIQSCCDIRISCQQILGLLFSSLGSSLPYVLWLLCSSVYHQAVWSLSSPNLNSWQRHLTALAFVLTRFSCVWLFMTLWTIIRQAPLSMGFSRQEYWSGLPCPRPGNLPDPCLLHGPR